MTSGTALDTSPTHLYHDYYCTLANIKYFTKVKLRKNKSNMIINLIPKIMNTNFMNVAKVEALNFRQMQETI